MIARSLSAAGADVSVLGSRVIDPALYPYPFLPRMPDLLFGSDRPDGVRLYAHRLSVWLGGAAAVRESRRELEPDIVHFQHAINKRLDHRLLKQLGQQTTVMWTAHDVLPHEHTRRDRARFARIYQAADGVIVHSQPAAEELQELSGVQATVIEHPVDDRVHATDRTDARRELGLPTEGRLLSALGFVRPYKGYELLADVWDALGLDAPTLLVMGELHSRSEQAVVDRLARSPRVVVRLGYAEDADLHRAISASDAILLPYSGGSDSGLLHLGRACGTPVIASDAAQLAASVVATDSGLTLPRTVAAWATAVRGPLPPPPPAPPSPEETGRAHLEAYQAAIHGATLGLTSRAGAGTPRAA